MTELEELKRDIAPERVLETLDRLERDAQAQNAAA